MVSRGMSRMAEYVVTRGSRRYRRSSARQSYQGASCCSGSSVPRRVQVDATYRYGRLLGMAHCPVLALCVDDRCAADAAWTTYRLTRLRPCFTVHDDRLR